jgi:hypothetical protein
MKVKHPLDNQLYELQSDGLIRVEDPVSKQAGLFKRDGAPVSGEIHYADPQMLIWVGCKQGQQAPEQ